MGSRQSTPILVLTENVTDPGQGTGLAQSVSRHACASRVFSLSGEAVKVQKSFSLSEAGCFHSTDCFRAWILRHPTTFPGGGERRDGEEMAT